MGANAMEESGISSDFGLIPTAPVNETAAGGNQTSTGTREREARRRRPVTDPEKTAENSATSNDTSESPPAEDDSGKPQHRIDDLV
jgi:hypothetical protein